MIRRRPPLLPLSSLSLLLLLSLPARAAEKPAHPDESTEKASAPEPAPASEPAAEHAVAKTSAPEKKSAAVEASHTSSAESKETGAAKHIEAATTAKPHPASEAASLLKLGTSLTDRADYDAAEIAFRQVLNAPHAAAEDVKSALLGLARMHRKQGALTKAAAIYERFLKEYPSDERTPDALLDLGRTLRSLGVYKLAITRFYNVINSTLKLPTAEGFDHYQLLAKTAQFEIAETHFQSGDYAEAGKFFSRLRLLDLAPADRARAHFKAAYSQRLGGELEAAVGTFRAFIAATPDDENVPEARYLLAVTLRELKHTQEAFQATLDLLHEEKSRIAADPKRWAYWQKRTGNQLANDFFESGDMLNAHAIYAGLADLSPDPAWRLPIVYQLALCYERLGIADRARTSYQSIVDGVGATPSVDLAELAKMAAWRLDQLDWHEKVTHQVTNFFETSTGKTPPPAPAAAKRSEDGSGNSAGPETVATGNPPGATSSTASAAEPAISVPTTPPAPVAGPAKAETSAIAAPKPALPAVATAKTDSTP